MALEIRSNRITLGPGTGELLHVLVESFTYPQQVVRAHVALRGFEARFVDGDHNIGRLFVQLTAGTGGPAPDGWELPVIAVLQLRDNGEDNEFQGWVDYVLFAETGVPRPPRDFPSPAGSRPG